MTDKFVIEPYMYIDQPEFEKAEVPMQANYYSDVKEKVDHQELETVEESISNRRFKDLSIPDKLHYLLHLPSEMPKIHCEVQTSEDTFRGVVLEEEGEGLIMRVFGKGYEKVSKAEIIEINLIGF